MSVYLITEWLNAVMLKVNGKKETISLKLLVTFFYIMMIDMREAECKVGSFVMPSYVSLKIEKS